MSPRGQAEYDDEPPPFSAQSVLEYEKYAEEERQGQASYLSPPYTNTSEPTATNTRRRRSRTYNEDRPRYGLYHDTYDMFYVCFYLLSLGMCVYPGGYLI